jgi:hypothetical protein
MQRACNLASRYVLKIIRHTPNDKVYLQALYRLVKGKNLPVNTCVELPLVIGYMKRTSRLPRVKDLSESMTSEELELVEDRLFIACMWVDRWGKKLEKVLIRFLGKDGIEKMMWAYYDVSDKTQGGIIFGHLLEVYTE